FYQRLSLFSLLKIKENHKKVVGIILMPTTFRLIYWVLSQPLFVCSAILQDALHGLPAIKRTSFPSKGSLFLGYLLSSLLNS
ncbi:hypothetical protein, partial [Thalassobacillus sp. B23F22_16]|uniref:hypothetical protein n=1 Tax=Thalassobacillus sp. B23F22_16 TaxID=3459513 RepID=UPI00373F0DA7